MLSASPIAAQLAAGQSPPGYYSSWRSAGTATQYAFFGQPVVQSGTQTTIELVAVGANGRVASGYNGTANLSSSDTSTSAILPKTAAFQGGYAYVKVTFATAGDQSVTATDNTTSTITGSATIDVTVPDVATQYYVAAKPTVQAGVQTTIEVMALDANGYVVRNYNGSATLTLTDSAGTVAPTSSNVTFTNGVATANVTFATAGSQTVTVSGALTPATSTSATPATLSGSAVVAVSAPAVAASYVAVLPSVVKVGTAVTVQLDAVDSTGHRVTSYDATETLTLTSTDGKATLSSPSVTFASGVATFTFTFETGGPQSVTATSGSLSGTGSTLVIAPVTPTTPTSPTTPTTPTTPSTSTSSGIVTTTSSNWSGYAVETNLNSPQSNSVTAVSGSWTVPAVTGTGTAYSAVWVGIDGLNSSTVEQLGTEEDVVNGRAEYSVWYEMYPLGSVAITNINVAAGNNMTASVVYSSTTGKFELSITDTTTNQTFSIAESASGAQRSSAEWIVEAPSSNRGVLQLANFGSVTFTNATATINGVTGPIDSSSWQATAMDISAGQGSIETSVTGLTDMSKTGSSSFTDTYQTGSSTSRTTTTTNTPNYRPGWRAPNISAQVATNNLDSAAANYDLRDRFFASFDV